jgi:DDE domain
MSNPFRYFNSSPEVIRLVVMMYVRYPLSLRNVEELLAERGIDISHETVRFWWNRFGPMFAAEIRKKRVAHVRGYPQWRWHLDEVFVKVNGKLCYLWRAVDHALPDSPFDGCSGIGPSALNRSGALVDPAQSSNWMVGIDFVGFRVQREPRARARPIEPTMPSAHRQAE